MYIRVTDLHLQVATTHSTNTTMIMTTAATATAIMMMSVWVKMEPIG